MQYYGTTYCSNQISALFCALQHCVRELNNIRQKANTVRRGWNVERADKLAVLEKSINRELNEMRGAIQFDCDRKGVVQEAIVAKLS